MKKAFLLFSCLLPLGLYCQVIFDVKFGIHQSKFDGMTDPIYFPSYIKLVRPKYQATDNEVFFGDIIGRQDNRLGWDFSLGIRKPLSKKWDLGLYVSYATYNNQQLRDCGLTENYPNPLTSYPLGYRIYQTFVFKDNFIFLSPEIQFSPLKKIAITISPSIWKRESARYDAAFMIKTSDTTGRGQGVSRTNPDYRKTGFVLKGGVLFYPMPNMNFGIEYTRFMTAINQEKQIEKNFYTSWGVKLGYSFSIVKKNN